VPRDNYNEVAVMICEKCGRIYRFPFGYQGDMKTCNQNDCGGRLQLEVKSGNKHHG